MKRTNILMIYTDQQSTWSVSALGAEDIHTPNIDRIGREGVILENFYTPCAVCTPSRGSFFTGEYPSRHGAWRNNLPLSGDAETFAQVLAGEGYQTGYAGKWHLAGPGKPQWLTPEESGGFEDCRYMYNRGHWKRVEEAEGGEHPRVTPYRDVFCSPQQDLSHIGDGKTYTTDWLCDKAAEYIRNRDRSRPFLYVVSIPDPHTPFCVRAPYDTMFDPEKLHLPETYYRYCPAWLPEGTKPGEGSGEDYSEAGGRRMLAQYLGEVKCIDDNVGRLTAVLEQEGILDDTMIIFTSDHGEYMGEHGLWGKNNLYPSCYRVPFLIRWSKELEAGRRVRELISAVDFKETLLKLVGARGPWKSSGRDASGLLRGDFRGNWEDKIYVNAMMYGGAGIMTDRYYTVFREDGLHMLFDMKEDPLQTENLYRDERYRERIRETREDLIGHCRSVDSPALAWLEKMGGELGE